jgi:hypothetical protein
VSIPDDLAAKVLFDSDHTCCICRSEKQKIQIHHIDEDPSNNAYENLAVICVMCHMEIHSTVPFARGFKPDLVRRYNESWRAILKARLLPDAGDAAKKELMFEGLLEVALACNGWASTFQIYTAPLKAGEPQSSDHMWTWVLSRLPPYSKEAYEHFRPLLSESLDEVRRDFERTLILFRDVLPYEVRSTLVRAQRQLKSEATMYASFHSFAEEARAGLFEGVFTRVIQLLAAIARDSRDRALKPFAN